MAITKEIQTTKIEVVGEYKHIQLAEDTIIKEDGIEISRSRHRRILQCSDIDAEKKQIAFDISSESTEVKNICNAVWTDEIKTAYANKLKAEQEDIQKSNPE